MLLLSQGRTVEAAAQLRPLYDDLRLVCGPDHDDTREIADILVRLRLAGG